MKRYDIVMEAVAAILRSELPNNEIETGEMYKDNDQLKHTIIIKSKDSTAAPVFYVEDMCERYCSSNDSVSEIANDIIKTYRAQVVPGAFMDIEWDNIKDKLGVRILEKSRNKNKLKDLVYTDLGNDLVMIYSISMSDEYATVITKSLAEEKYDIEKLKKRALECAQKHSKAKLSSMEMFMFGAENAPNLLETDEDPESPMLILTNDIGYQGASVLFYPGVMNRIREKLKGNYYILPSSVHELIVLPDNGDFDPRSLKTMVLGANSDRRLLDEREVLSDNVFYYDGDSDKLSIVA